MLLPILVQTTVLTIARDTNSSKSRKASRKCTTAEPAPALNNASSLIVRSESFELSTAPSVLNNLNLIQVWQGEHAVLLTTPLLECRQTAKSALVSSRHVPRLEFHHPRDWALELAASDHNGVHASD